jgi:MYXO-CTERM domain-containing protein
MLLLLFVAGLISLRGERERKNVNRFVATGLCALSVATASSNAGIIFAGSSFYRSAAAEFTVVGTQMTVRLTNTSMNDVLTPLGVLTGIFFNVAPYAGAVNFTPVVANLGAGSTVIFGPDGGGNVSGEWAYRQNITGAPKGMSYGISSAGLQLFGPGDLFPGGPVLTPPVQPDGLNYGITSAADDMSTGNAAVTGQQPLIKNEVILTLNCPQGFDASAIQSVYFQYGTALDEGGFEVPAPGSFALVGLAGLVAGRRRR